MKINFAAQTIEVTKTFANKASRFGSEEYQMLRTTMLDLPDFKIVVKATQKVQRRTPYGTLNYEQMIQYISTHEKSEELMDEFMKLRNLGYNYGQVKQWFLHRCFEFDNFAA